MLAAAIADRPVWLTELGVKLGDVGGPERQAQFLTRTAAVLARIGTAIVPAACWFAWSDGCGAPSERGDQAFGLVDEDGRRRPAWAAFQAAAGPRRLTVVTSPDKQ